jgi:hypothetical protein
MKRKLSAIIVGLVALGLGGREAAAWTRFHNNSANTIWTMHAFASTKGFGCGWADGCNGSGIDDWRLQRWWQIAPGGTVQVHGFGWGNAVHDAYGEDAFGHFWGGGGGVFPAGNDANDVCGVGLETSRRVTMFHARTTWCCGIGCPGDGTVNFN